MRCLILALPLILATPVLAQSPQWSGTGSATTSASQPAVDYSKDTTPRSALYRLLIAVDDGDEKALAGAMIVVDPAMKKFADAFFVTQACMQKIRLAAHDQFGPKGDALDLGEPTDTADTYQRCANGAIQIEGDKATISLADDPTKIYAVKKDDRWILDLDRTIQALPDPPMSQEEVTKNLAHLPKLQQLAADLAAKKFKSADELQAAFNKITKDEPATAPAASQGAQP